MAMVSSRRAVLDAVEDMGKETLRGSDVMRRWAVQAEKKIGGKYIYKRSIYVLPIENGREVVLPCETFKMIDLVMGKQDDSCESIFNTHCIGNYTVDWTSLDTGIGIVVIQPNNIERPTSATYDLVSTRDGYVLQFRCTTTESYVTVLLLTYQRDHDGYIMVEEEHLTAISIYIQMMVASRSQFGPDRMGLGFYDRLERKWGKECSLARANTSKITEQQKEYLLRVVNDPLSGSIVEYY